MIGMPAMFLLDLLGAVLTLITLLFLFLDGYLVARALLRERAESDPLALAIGSLLAATALGVGIGLVLGGARTASGGAGPAPGHARRAPAAVAGEA